MPSSTRFRVRLPVAPTFGAIAQWQSTGFIKHCRRSFTVAFMGIGNFIKDELPAEAERSSYIGAWNNQLESKLRLSETIAAKVVQQTEGFSFAYMKELFLSSMMQWMATKGAVSMDQINLSQAVRLREQMVLQAKEDV